MKETPRKYLRIVLKGNRGSIALTDGSRMYIKRALFAEIKDNHVQFTYEFNSEKTPESVYNLVIAFRKNKELAYVAGHDDIDDMGYVHCKSKDSDQDLDYPATNSIFCGIVTTDIYTILFSLGGDYTKSYQCELVRGKECPDIQDVLCLLSKYKSLTSLEAQNVEKE